MILHHAASACIIASVQVMALFQAVGLCNTATTTIPNESANPTKAGTKASQINSLISKLSLFSLPPNSPSPTTYLSVKRGEKIA